MANTSELHAGCCAGLGLVSNRCEIQFGDWNRSFDSNRGRKRGRASFFDKSLGDLSRIDMLDDSRPSDESSCIKLQQACISLFRSKPNGYLDCAAIDRR